MDRGQQDQKKQDLVCAQCGSDLVYIDFEGSLVPSRCSNERCPYSDQSEDFVWTAKRSEWQPPSAE